MFSHPRRIIVHHFLFFFRIFVLIAMLHLRRNQLEIQYNAIFSDYGILSVFLLTAEFSSALIGKTFTVHKKLNERLFVCIATRMKPIIIFDFCSVRWLFDANTRPDAQCSSNIQYTWYACCTKKRNTIWFLFILFLSCIFAFIRE